MKKILKLLYKNKEMKHSNSKSLIEFVDKDLTRVSMNHQYQTISIDVTNRAPREPFIEKSINNSETSASVSHKIPKLN